MGGALWLKESGPPTSFAREVAARKSNVTPAMRQFHAAKAEHPDAIIFFRLGDFYEMFHEDAIVGAQALDLTLTARHKGTPNEIPMAGVPHHAAQGYIAKLISLGHKVAICEQIGDASKAKGLVPREVVRVITPGLVTDSEQLDGRANHYLAAIHPEPSAGEKEQLGLALLDLSTGELLAAEIADRATLVAELTRLDPRELMIAEQAGSLFDLAKLSLPRVVIHPDEALEDIEAGQVLIDVLGEEAASDAERDIAEAALFAAARVLRYAKRCSPMAELPVRRITPWDPGTVLRIDEVAQTHLELVRSMSGNRSATLLAIIDETKTPPGARLLRRYLLAPLVEVEAIKKRHDAVEAFVDNPLIRSDLREILGKVGDLERLSVRAALGEATPKDLGALRDGLLAAPSVIEKVRELPDASSKRALGLDPHPPDPCADLATRLEQALVERPPPLAREGGIFREGFDAELDETRRLKEKGSELLLELEGRLRESLDIPTLKIRYTRVFGWYIEVSRAQAKRVPESFRRKQTVANAERYSNDELDELEEKILHAEERHSEREAELYTALVREIGGEADRIRSLAAQLAKWDVFAGLAEVAHRRDYVRPEIDDSEALELKDSRHPVVEELAAAGRFVPNDVKLDTEGERLWLITGPNMAGKSTLMRQVALTVILAQMGSFVPAKEARIGIVDRVLSRVGASDDVSRGESTFMVEMRETASILRHASRKSLVILDEIGRGTSTYDGLAIAWAVAEHMHDSVRCRAMFATHYHELTDLCKTKKYAANYSVSAREVGDDIVFLHKISQGAVSRSYGIAVARLAGLPEVVLARAKAILSSLEAGAALPSGAHATVRGRSKAGDVQLDLFAKKPAPSPAIETLKAIEVDRLTPLEALQFLAKLKEMVREEEPP